MSEQQQTTPSEAPTTAPATTPATASPALSLNVTAKPFVPKVSAKPFVPRSLAKPAATTAPTPAPVTTSAPAESESTTSEPAPEEPQKPVALADTREHLNIVFIGHVDAGKSTICGMLKNLTGQVDQRLLEKLQREAKEKNRETWVYAYLMDLCEEEREKGKTIEVSTARFETKNKRYTILDAPGHEYYVNNMISGASQADIAVLVISAKKNEFERGFDKGGQTREHATLAKTLGVKKLVCVVNKMDEPSVNWENERYEEIVKKVSLFLKQSGYNLEKEVKFLPISGQSGMNMTQKLDPAVCSWYDGPCLTEVLDNLEPIERNVTGPLRIPIVDKFKDTKKGAVAVIGKIESGSISVGDRLLLMPTHREVECVNLRLHGNNDDEDTSVPSVRAGDNVQVSVKGLDEAEVGFGFVLCDIKHPPVPKVKEFIGQFAVVDKNMFAAGYSAVIHIHTAIEQFTITSLMKKLDKKTGKELPDKPKFGKTGDVITARFELEKPVCMEKFSVLPQLGRFTVREKGTVMVGKVTAIKPMN